MTAPEPTPRTAAGRALLGAIQGEPKPSTRLSMILAIEAEAAAAAIERVLDEVHRLQTIYREERDLVRGERLYKQGYRDGLDIALRWLEPGVLARHPAPDSPAQPEEEK